MLGLTVDGLVVGFATDCSDLPWLALAEAVVCDSEDDGVLGLAFEKRVEANIAITDGGFFGGHGFRLKSIVKNVVEGLGLVSAWRKGASVGSRGCKV